MLYEGSLGLWGMARMDWGWCGGASLKALELWRRVMSQLGWVAHRLIYGQLHKEWNDRYVSFTFFPSYKL